MLGKMLEAKSAFSKKYCDLVLLYQNCMAGRKESISQECLRPYDGFKLIHINTWQTKSLRKNSLAVKLLIARGALN